MRTVSWTGMADGTREDYGDPATEFESHARSNLVPNLLTMLEVLRERAGPDRGFADDTMTMDSEMTS